MRVSRDELTKIWEALTNDIESLFMKLEKRGIQWGFAFCILSNDEKENEEDGQWNFTTGFRSALTDEEKLTVHSQICWAASEIVIHKNLSHDPKDDE